MHGLLLDLVTNNYLKKTWLYFILFEQNMSVEMAKLQLVYLLVFSAQAQTCGCQVGRIK